MNQNQIETEKALIGAILLEPNRVLRLCQQKKLTEYIFQYPEFIMAYRSSFQMFEGNEAIDVVTLSRKTKIAINTLTSCLENTIWTHAEAYVDILMENESKRKLLAIPRKITDSIRTNQNPQDIIRSTISDLQDIQKSTDQDNFDVWSLSDIQNYIPNPANYIAGNGWLRRSGGTILTGGTGIGKSILSEQISLCVAAGVNILGCISIKQPFGVLHIQAENDQDTIKRDTESIIKNLNLDPKIIQENFHICHAYGLSGKELSAWLRRQCEKYKPDFINIDPYQAFIPGDVDMNSSTCFLSFKRPIETLMRDFNAALMLVAHTPKPRDRESWTTRESVYMSTGSAVMPNWARTSAELTQVADNDYHFRLRFGKNNERTGIVDDNQHAVRDLFIEHSSSIKEPFWKVSESQEEPRQTSKIGGKIISTAIEHPEWTYSQIAQKVGCSKGTVANWHPNVT